MAIPVCVPCALRRDRGQVTYNASRDKFLLRSSTRPLSIPPNSEVEMTELIDNGREQVAMGMKEFVQGAKKPNLGK